MLFFYKTVLFMKVQNFIKLMTFNYLFEVLSVASHYFLPSCWQLSDTISKKRCVFWVNPRIAPFFDFFIRAEMLISQAVCHRSKQMVVEGSNVWRVRQVGQDFSCLVFLHFSISSMLCLNASIPFDSDPLWLVHSVSTAHNAPNRAGRTKCRA